MEIRTYSKKELALCYFPQCENPHTAVNRLMRWINRCAQLHKALKDHGYQTSSRWFSPQEVRLIIQYLGDP